MQSSAVPEHTGQTLPFDRRTTWDHPEVAGWWGWGERCLGCCIWPSATTLSWKGAGKWMDDCVVVICVGVVVVYLSYSVGWGLMGVDTDLFSGSGFSTSSLSSSSSDSSRLCLSSFRSSLLLLSSSLLLLSSSLLWLFLDLPTSTAFPQFPARNGTADGAQGTEVRNKMNPRWPKWSFLSFCHIQHIERCLPMESSKVIGLVPTDGSIIVISNRDANSRKSSLSPRKPWRQKNKNKKKDLRASGSHTFSTWNTLSPVKVCLKGWSSVLDPLLYILPLR